MRHFTLSTTTEVYGHLLRHVAHRAVDAIDTALCLAEQSLVEDSDLTATTATAGWPRRTASSGRPTTQCDHKATTRTVTGNDASSSLSAR